MKKLSFFDKLSIDVYCKLTCALLRLDRFIFGPDYSLYSRAQVYVGDPTTFVVAL